MGTIKRFEDLKAWQVARDVARTLYDISRRENIRRDFSLVDQLRKTALSPMSNIAEGFGRRSDKAFAHFLSIAHGSVAEIQSLLYVALDQRYIDQATLDEAYEQADHCSRLIRSLSDYLANPAGRKP